MALQKTNVPVPLASGLQTKTDESQDQLSGLRVLENVLFDTPNKLIKRKGYNKLNLQLTSGQEIEDPKYLSVFNEELGILSSSNYYALTSSLEKWTNKGQVFTAFPESTSIIRNDKQQKNIDISLIDNIAAYVYEDSAGVHLSVMDLNNDNFIISNTLISASGTAPRVENIENTFYIFYADGTNLKYRKVNIIQPSLITSEQIISSDFDNSVNLLDCSRLQSRIYVTYMSSTSGGAIRLFFINSDDSLSTIITVGSEAATTCLTITGDSSSRIIITYYDGSDVKIFIRSFTLAAQILSPTSIETIANITNAASIEDSSGVYTTFYEQSSSNTFDHLIKTNTINLAATTGTPQILKRSVGIASKPFKVNDIIYITAIHENTLQSTYFILNSSSQIVSKISPSLGGKLITDNVLCSVENLSSTKVILASQIKGRSVIDDDEFFSLLGVTSTVLDFDPVDPFQNETLGQNHHISGGILMMYDGDRVVEHGFHLFPEGLSDGGTATSGGFLSDGAYQYAAVYAWTDNKGYIHRSAPSVGLPVTLSGSTANQTQSIVVPTLRLTQKENVIIELYRTEQAGTIFYKLTDVSTPDLNDPTVDSITIVDGLSDADLISREVLYTTGGVLENIAAPSSSIIESFSDRIALAGLEDKNVLQFSKIRFDGAPIEFNDILTIQVNSKGGPITALKTMDEKLVIFKESAIFYLSGDGPNNLGAQDTFIKPELVSSDIGCINVNSVVLMPDGLMFKSKKGIYLLNRSAGLEYIGASVESFNNLRISSAVVVPDQNQVRFTTTTGDALVYNYFVKNWASFTNHKALSAANIGFDYYYLRTDGTLFKEDESIFTDNGTSINIKFESGWISFAGIQDFQRVYKLLMLGTYASPHKLRIRIAYDFVDAFVQEVIIDTGDFTDSTTYGEYSPYGLPVEIPYGGSGNAYQARIDLARQKCQSIKIRVEEIQHEEESYGEGLSISNILFQVGKKRGPNKMNTGQQYGTR